MNWDQIKGNWKEWKGKMRTEFGQITDDELEEAKGDRERLVGLVQQKYGAAREDAEKKVDSFFDQAA
ncbi:MAG: CsbD family protein [Pseudomonadota bacterium]